MSNRRWLLAASTVLLRLVYCRSEANEVNACNSLDIYSVYSAVCWRIAACTSNSSEKLSPLRSVLLLGETRRHGFSYGPTP